MVTISKKCQLNIRFHNPNTPEATANYIAKVFLEVNQAKIDRILQEEAAGHTQAQVKEESCYVG